MAIYKEIDSTDYTERTTHSVPSDKKTKIDNIIDDFVTFFKEEELS